MPAFKKVNKKELVTKCTPEVIEKICNVLRIGAYPETAAVMSGVCKLTFLDWMKRAHPGVKGHRKIYAQLLNAVERAIEDATCRDLMNIDKCAMGKDPVYAKDSNGNLILNEKGNPVAIEYGIKADWSASRWRLERRSPKQWGPVQKVELTGKDGGPLASRDVTPLSEQELQNQLDENLRKLKLLE